MQRGQRLFRASRNGNSKARVPGACNMISAKRQAVLDEVETQLRNYYPSLYLAQRGNHSIIKGVFPVQFGGKVVDTFLVEIELPRRFPEEVPSVREMSGRIPKLADRHV